MIAKHRRTPVFQLVVIIALTACLLLLRYDTKLGLLGLGIFAVTVSVVIEYYSSKIWRMYKRNYQPSKNKLFNSLNRPREIYNVINVYVLWPGVFVLGLWCIHTALGM